MELSGLPPVRSSLVEPLAGRDDRARKLLLCHYGRRLRDSGHIAGGSGNLSVALQQRGAIAITPRGRDKGSLVPSDLVTVPLESPEPPPSGASSELPMHRACYLGNDGVGAVIHSHSPALTAMGLRSARLDEELPELAQAIGPARLVPFHPSGSDELAHAVRAAVEGGVTVVVLARHGAVTVGADLAEAYDRLALAELSARSVLLSRGEDPGRTS